jgi:hypothetical protein
MEEGDTWELIESQQLLAFLQFEEFLKDLALLLFNSQA